jgi:hypothetical protein
MTGTRERRRISCRMISPETSGSIMSRTISAGPRSEATPRPAAPSAAS